MSKRARRRELRKLERDEKRSAKAARLRERPEMVAAVRKSVTPPEGKQARTGADPGTIMQELVTWTSSSADRTGDWSWGARDWDNDTWDKVIEPKLLLWEKLTWAEIGTHTTNGHRAHHEMDVGILRDEASMRWLDLDIDTEVAFRFRYGGKPRLWGYRSGANFVIVWWDPDHQVYPTDPS